MKQLPYYAKYQSGSSQRSQNLSLLKVTRSTLEGKTHSVSCIHEDPHGSLISSVISIDIFNHTWVSRVRH